jgi:amino acid transporter
LYVTAAKEGDGSSSGPINDGFDNDKNFAKNHSQAVCFAIPIVAYSFLGIEVIAVTAFEAKNSTSLRWPSRIIAYAIFILYFLCTIGETLTVGWRDTHLPQIYQGLANSTNGGGLGTMTPPNSTSLVVNAAWAAGHHNIASLLNGCLVFSVLSASNTSLYVSSRTLYGLTHDVPDTNWFGKRINKLSLVVRQTGVPAPALLFSAVSFFWLPFLQLKAGYAIQDLIEIMAVSASVSCLIVWAALCLAFIRYERWLEICDEGLKTKHQHYRRHSSQYTSWTFLFIFQPYIAWLGLAGCILVFGFTSATWWSTPATFAKVAVAYAAHILLFGLFVISKLINRRWWVKLNPDVTVLVKALDRLRWLKNDQRPTGVEQLMQSLEAQSAPRVDGMSADNNTLEL